MEFYHFKKMLKPAFWVTPVDQSRNKGHRKGAIHPRGSRREPAFWILTLNPRATTHASNPNVHSHVCELIFDFSTQK